MPYRLHRVPPGCAIFIITILCLPLSAQQVPGVDLEELSFDPQSPNLNLKGVVKRLKAAREHDAKMRAFRISKGLPVDNKKEGDGTTGPHCLTGPETTLHRIGKFLSNQARMRNKKGLSNQAGIQTIASVAQDATLRNLMVITEEGEDGALIYNSAFDLSNTGILFTPDGNGGYDVESDSTVFAQDANANVNANLSNSDDLTEVFTLQMGSFPFFGVNVSQVHVSTNGFVDMGSRGSKGITESESEFIFGGPTVSLLWDDLDPGNTISDTIAIKNDATEFVVEFNAVPFIGNNNNRVNMKLTLFSDGRILLTYGSLSHRIGIMGLNHGFIDNTIQPARPRDFSSVPYTGITGSIYERFLFGGTIQDIDIIGCAAAIQESLEGSGNENSFDTHVFYPNFLNASVTGGGVAFYLPLRNDTVGINHPSGTNFDVAALAGGNGLLSGVIHMGTLQQWDDDPDASFQGSNNSHNSILAQEFGHRFGSFVTINGEDILGRANAHWSYFLDSPSAVQAVGQNSGSSMEGNFLVDKRPTTQTFDTDTEKVEGYSPLDLYLWGFIPPTDSRLDAITLLSINNVSPSLPRSDSAPGDDGITITLNNSNSVVTFSITDITNNNGDRSPDSVSAPRDYQATFVAVGRESDPYDSTELQKLENFRSAFELYFATHTENQGTMSIFAATGTGTGGGGDDDDDVGGGVGGGGGGGGGGGDDGGGSGQSNCCAATILLGSKSAPGMDLLYAVRDQILRPSDAGSDIVEFYYSSAPPVARKLSRSSLLKAVGRRFLKQAAIQPLQVVSAEFPPYGPGSPKQKENRVARSK